MKHTIIHLGAYLILLTHILLALLVAAGAVYVFLMFPEGNVAKKSMTAAGLGIVAACILIMGLAVFEALLKLADLHIPQPEKTGAFPNKTP